MNCLGNYVRVVTIALAVAAAQAGETGFMGGRLQLGVYAPNTSDAGLIFGPFVWTVTPGSRFSVPPAQAQGWVDVPVNIDVTDKSLIFDYSNTAGYTGYGSNANFVGYVFTTLGEIPPITNVTIDPSNTSLGLTASRISFNDHQIFVDMKGLVFNPQSKAKLDVTFGTLATTSKILPQFAFGGGWYSALYFTNTSSNVVSFAVNFVADSGDPLIVPSVQGSSKNITLEPGASTVIEAPNSGPLSQGYVPLTLPTGVEGYGVFRQSVPGVPDQEAVVPLTGSIYTKNILIWDDTTSVTAVSIVNPSSLANVVTVTVRDASGSVLGTSTVSLPAKGKKALALRDLPGLAAMAGKQGTAEFSASAGSVAVLGLRFHGTAFTSIPATVQ